MHRHLPKTVFCALIGLLTWTGTSEAAIRKPLPNPVCDHARATAVSRAFDYLDKMDSSSPVVPSNEAAYFEKENSASRSEDAESFNAMA